MKHGVLNSQTLVRSAVILLIAKAFLWIVFGIAYFTRQGGLPPDLRILHIVMPVLMFIDALGYAFIAWGIGKRSKIVFLIAFPFLILNALLAVTDQFGLFDLLVLLLDLVILAILVVTRKTFTSKERVDLA